MTTPNDIASIRALAERLLVDCAEARRNGHMLTVSGDHASPLCLWLIALLNAVEQEVGRDTYAANAAKHMLVHAAELVRGRQDGWGL